MVDLRLVVGRITPGQIRHRLQIGLHAASMIAFAMVGVQRFQRSDVAAFSRRRGEGLGLLQQGEPLRQASRRWRTERVEEQALADAPVGDCAGRVECQGALELAA